MHALTNSAAPIRLSCHIMPALCVAPERELKLMQVLAAYYTTCIEYRKINANSGYLLHRPESFLRSLHQGTRASTIQARLLLTSIHLTPIIPSLSSALDHKTGMPTACLPMPRL